jgi:hypothetical protein
MPPESVDDVRARPKGPRSAAGWIALGLLWVLAVGSGFSFLWKYKLQAGESQGAPEVWPAESHVPRRADRATLVLFAHPKCPCTRASLAELARLMSRFDDRLSADVVFLRPPDVGADWDQTDLWQRAAGIPGVTTVRDDGGLEAARFGAATSGIAVLYDARGRLLFSGGLTSARGHEGDSFGIQRIRALLLTGEADRHDAPVFGCSLRHGSTVRQTQVNEGDTR